MKFYFYYNNRRRFLRIVDAMEYEFFFKCLVKKLINIFLILAIVSLNLGKEFRISLKPVNFYEYCVIIGNW